MAYDKTQQTRINAGLCKDCGKPRGEDGTKVFCRLCAKSAAERATLRKKRMREEWKAAGVCYNCGAIRDNETTWCSKCREKRAGWWEKYGISRRQAHESGGLCRTCGRERYYESNYCRKHFMEHIARKYRVPMRLYEAMLQKLESTNLSCFYTGIPLIPGKNACIDHMYSRSQYKDKISDLDNLVWCDKWVNRMKGYMSYQDFIVLCQTIVDRAKLQ